VCGPIEDMFLYTTNQIISGGANILIEVIRQCMLDLQEKLGEHGLPLPQQAMFQFDNCGENKNKLMFTYLSLLIERSDFTRIQVNFLIAGHTHCVDDQYFSTLSQKNKECEFIGTPMAMKHLFTLVKSSRSKYKPPLVQKQIEVVFNVWEALAPYMNNDIHYYQVI
jgi:hypothetical protein